MPAITSVFVWMVAISYLLLAIVMDRTKKQSRLVFKDQDGKLRVQASFDLRASILVCLVTTEITELLMPPQGLPVLDVHTVALLPFPPPPTPIHTSYFARYPAQSVPDEGSLSFPPPGGNPFLSQGPPAGARQLRRANGH